MILRKPYAFLIKYFKLIHIVLALLSSYLIYRTINLVNFFNSYVSSNYSGNFYPDFYLDYVDPLFYLVIIVILVGMAGICFLFLNRKKPIKLYLYAIIYLVVMIVFITIIKNTMISLETNTITAENSRILRDLCIIFMLPEFPLIILFILRAIGLNTKKLNFADDLKELKINESDNEEVEITFKHDGVKTKRTIRRFFREFGYYIKENKLIFITICTVLGLILIIVFPKLLPQKVDYTYRQGDAFVVNGLTYKIEDSIASNIDYNGNVIEDGSYYIVLKLSITNDTVKDVKIDYNNFRLVNGSSFMQ